MISCDTNHKRFNLIGNFVQESHSLPSKWVIQLLLIEPLCCACVGEGAGPVARHRKKFSAAERIEKPQLDSPHIYLDNKGTASLFRIIVLRTAALWIRLQIGSGFNGVPGSGFGSRRSKMTHKNRRKSINFISSSVGCPLLMAEGFSCSLDVL